MKNEFLRVRGWGCVLVVSALAAGACSDDNANPGPNTAGSSTAGGSAGSSSGGAAGTAGKAATSGGSAGSGGALVGGSAGSNRGEGGAITAEGGGAGEGGAIAVDGGASGASGDSGAAGSAGAGGDGGGDVQPAVCDFSEVENEMDQATGFTVGATPKVLCGNFDTGHFSANLLDRDRYELSVPKGDLLVRLDVPNFAALTRVEIQLDGQTIVVNQRSIVFTRHDLFAASTITIRGYSAADVAQPVPYQLSIATDDIDARCPMLNTANFTEAGDGADNLGNNVYEFSGSDASFTAAVDAAEATGITLSDTASYRINGVSADIPAGFDKDSYAFHTAPGISQVTVRVDWEGGRNVDLYLFKAGTLTSAGAGDEFTTQSPDYFTLLVQPDTDYVLVARCLSGSTPFDYSMTMCGGTYRVDGK